MSFWGLEVKPGNTAAFVPPPESSKLHLSQASLAPSAPAAAKAALLVKVSGQEAPLVVCRLREGATESLGLDLVFDSYTEFSVEGPAAIHLTGYYMPEYDIEDVGDEYSDEDDEGHGLIGYDEYGVPILHPGDDFDSEDDSDFEDHSGDEEDSEEGSEEEEGDEDGLRQLGRGRKVVIEEITDDDKTAKGQRLALPAPEPKKQQGAKEKATANGKAAEFSDDDVSASDEEEDDEDEEEEGSEEEEEESESEEEEEPAPAPKQQKQAAAAGQKRKAEPAAAPAKKQAVEDAKKGGKPAAAAATPGQQKQQQQQLQQQLQQQQLQQQQPKSAAKQQAAAQQAGKTPAKTPAKDDAAPAANELPSSNQKVRRFANGFEIEDVKKGRADGKLAKPGKKVVVRYVGRLKSNGKVFDQTKGNATFAFRLGVGEVIKGWDVGVQNMRVGDKRKLTIPPQMAYGSSGVKGAIPPNATLSFDVELVDVK